MTQRDRTSRILIAVFVVAIIAVIAFGSRTLREDEQKEELTFSGLIERVEQEPSSIELITFKPRDRAIEVLFTNEVASELHYPSEEAQFELQRSLEAKGVAFDSEGTGGSVLGSLLVFLLPLLLIIAIWVFLFRRMRGGGAGGVMGIGKSRAKRHTPDMPRVTFRDVAGADEAVEELEEIKEFLAKPAPVPLARSPHPKGCGCSTGLRARARRCSRARWPARRACRSSRSQAPISSRCSSGSVRAVCATCSIRPSRQPRQSSSSMRSMPLDVTAAPGSVAVTTSASRR